MPLVDRLRAHLRKRIPAEDVKLVSPLSGSNQLYWRAAQPASHGEAVFLPIGQRWLFDTRELSKTTWSKCQKEPSFMAAQYQRSNMGEPAEYERGPYGHLQPVSRRDEHHTCRAALTRHRDR